MDEAQNFVKYSNYPDGYVDIPDALCQLARTIRKGAYLHYYINIEWPGRLTIKFADGSKVSYNFERHIWQVAAEFEKGI